MSGPDLPTQSITDNNTTYSVATTSANGLLSSTDKAALDKLKGVLPYFLVYYNGSEDTEFTSTVLFNTKVYDTTSSFSTSTGKFTAPVAGIYLFTFNYYTNDVDSTLCRPTIHISGGASKATVQMNTMCPGSISAIARMAAGNTAHVGPYSTTWPISFYATGFHNSFSGTLLSYV